MQKNKNAAIKTNFIWFKHSNTMLHKCSLCVSVATTSGDGGGNAADGWWWWRLVVALWHTSYNTHTIFALSFRRCSRFSFFVHFSCCRPLILVHFVLTLARLVISLPSFCTFILLCLLFCLHSTQAHTHTHWWKFQTNKRTPEPRAEKCRINKIPPDFFFVGVVKTGRRRRRKREKKTGKNYRHDIIYFYFSSFICRTSNIVSLKFFSKSSIVLSPIQVLRRL